VIRRLAPRDAAWTLGEAGTTPHAEYHGGGQPDDEAQA